MDIHIAARQGPGPQWIAEVSSNHQRDLERCYAVIDAAAAIGCDGVKFQSFRIDELFASEVLERSAAPLIHHNIDFPNKPIIQ